MLDEGKKAPAFSLPNQHGKKVSLKDFAGKKLVLYFYPRDNTPGCTREACDFRDHVNHFSQKNTVIIGISMDKPQQHQKFKGQYTLPFTLLADEKGNTCEAYGVINKKSLFGRSFLGIERTTFLIDEKGKIEKIWRKVKVNGHAQQVLDELH